MDYSIEHAKVKELVEKATCSGAAPREVVECIRRQIEAAGYVPSAIQLLDSNVDIAEREEDARFIRIEAVKGGGAIHIFTFAILKPGGVYKALWLQSAVLEK